MRIITMSVIFVFMTLSASIVFGSTLTIKKRSVENDELFVDYENEPTVTEVEPESSFIEDHIVLVHFVIGLTVMSVLWTSWRSMKDYNNVE